VKVGDEVGVKIIGIEDEKISLSMKRLKDDPWLKKVKEIKVGDKIKGEVSRITPFGAFVKLPQGIEALVHISELSEKHIASPDEIVEGGKKYEFKIISMDIDNHKLALSLKDTKTGKKEKSTEKSEKKEVSKKSASKTVKSEKTKSKKVTSSKVKVTKKKEQKAKK
jgi:small subunit ribosomal protein S1